MNATQIALLQQEMGYIKDALVAVKKSNSEEHSSVICLLKEIAESSVTKTEFRPVKTLVYWLVWLMLMSMVGAIVKHLFVQ